MANWQLGEDYIVDVQTTGSTTFTDFSGKTIIPGVTELTVDETLNTDNILNRTTGSNPDKIATTFDSTFNMTVQMLQGSEEFKSLRKAFHQKSLLRYTITPRTDGLTSRDAQSGDLVISFSGILTNLPFNPQIEGVTEMSLSGVISGDVEDSEYTP